MVRQFSLCDGHGTGAGRKIDLGVTLRFLTVLGLKYTTDSGGTALGSFMRNSIFGVFGSRRSNPSPSRIMGAVMEKAGTPGPTTSISSPAANLLRRDSTAFPSPSQAVTIASTCQSRTYRAESVYCPGCPNQKPVE